MSNPSSDKTTPKDASTAADLRTAPKKPVSHMVKSVIADTLSKPAVALGIIKQSSSADTPSPPKNSTPSKKEVQPDQMSPKWAATPEESNHQTSFTASAVDATLGTSPPAEKEKSPNKKRSSKCEVPPKWINGLD